MTNRERIVALEVRMQLESKRIDYLEGGPNTWFKVLGGIIGIVASAASIIALILQVLG